MGRELRREGICQQPAPPPRVGPHRAAGGNTASGGGPHRGEWWGGQSRGEPRDRCRNDPSRGRACGQPTGDWSHQTRGRTRTWQTAGGKLLGEEGPRPPGEGLLLERVGGAQGSLSLPPKANARAPLSCGALAVSEGPGLRKASWPGSSSRSLLTTPCPAKWQSRGHTQVQWLQHPLDGVFAERKASLRPPAGGTLAHIWVSVLRGVWCTPSFHAHYTDYRAHGT